MKTFILFVAALLTITACRPSESEISGQTDSSAAIAGTASDTAKLAGTSVVARGRFTDKGGQQTSGGYRVESTGGDLQLILEDDFRTDDGPDLHVVLSMVGVEEVESENAAADVSTLIVSPLTKLEGEQHYDLPDDLDLSGFNSVLIHCVEFTHLYGAAPLTVISK